MYYLSGIFGKGLWQVVLAFVFFANGLLICVVRTFSALLGFDLDKTIEIEAAKSRINSTQVQLLELRKSYGSSTRQMHIYDEAVAETPVSNSSLFTVAEGAASDFMKVDHQLMSRIIDAAKEVYCVLGAGLEQEVYQEGLHLELREEGLASRISKTHGRSYKGSTIGRQHGDLLIEGRCKVNLRVESSIKGGDFVSAKDGIVKESLDLGILINFGVNGVECRRVYHPKRRLMYNRHQQKPLERRSKKKSRKRRSKADTAFRVKNVAIVEAGLKTRPAGDSLPVRRKRKRAA